jgi:hypothetical protein
VPAGPGAWQLATLGIMVSGLTLIFIRLCRMKTDGHWAWRWGTQR